MLSAASALQAAGPLPGARRPAFSYLLLGAAFGWGEASGGDGIVMASEAIDWVRVALEDSRGGRNLQEPEWKGVDVVLGGGRVTGPDPAAIGRALAAGSAAREEDAEVGRGNDLLATLEKAKRAEHDRKAEEDRRQQESANAERRLRERRAAESDAKEEAFRQGSAPILKEAEREWVGIKDSLSEGSAPEVRAVVDAYVAKYESASVSVGTERRAVDVRGVQEARAWVNLWGTGTGVTAARPANWTSPTLGLMVGIPAGSFTMGCMEGRDDVAGGCRSDEGQVEVRISKGFLMMEHEVTQAEWGLVIDEPLSAASFCPKCPVQYTTWADARRFSEMASNRDGVRYRLPTEAEWEWAARAGTTLPYSGADEAGLSSVAWHTGNSGTNRHKVCAKSRNAFGLCDMSGNLREWTQDSYAAKLPGGTDPSNWSGSLRVLRGGSKFEDPRWMRIASRGNWGPDVACSDCGFRLVKPVP